VLDTLYQAEKLLTPEQIQQYDWNYLTIINLRAETLYTMGRYESAYQLQSEYINQVLAYHQRSNMKEVQSIRLKFESEQADLQRQLLEKQRSLQAVQLDKLQQEQQQQRWLITGGIVSLIILAWLFYGLHKGQKHLKRKARTDSLTGVANRRRIMQLGELTFSHAKSTQQPISVLMLDVDHFKHINDQYGHKVGDAVLVELVGIIGTVLRDNDHVGRFGGEEFIIVLPETNHTQALAIAERIRQVIEHFNWAGIGVSAVTVSIGIASNERSEYKHFSALLAHADAMLYQAKSEGRNRVCL
jgi:diguanylate cyclase (GGDEF)-like protein